VDDRDRWDDGEPDEAAAGEMPWEVDRGLPGDARRMGLSPNVPDGAMLQFAGALDSSKVGHRIVAWVLLAAFLFPVLLTVLRLLG
jgi:hypothetical protein